MAACEAWIRELGFRTAVLESRPRGPRTSHNPPAGVQFAANSGKLFQCVDFVDTL